MDVKLPKLGEGADSGVVVNVFVKEGDPVAKGQAIIELENEKAVASIPATAAGVVAKIHVKPGDKISVGQRLISLNESGKPAAAPAPAAKRARGSRCPPCAHGVTRLSKERGRGRERGGKQLRSLRRWPRRRFAEWPVNWALIYPRFAAVSRADASSSVTCAPTFSG